MSRIVTTALSPNTQFDDVLVALGVLVRPWIWQRGSAVSELERRWMDYFKHTHAFTFERGRSALYALLKTRELHAGDEVLIQSFTCVAVPNAVTWAGGTPVYVDIDPATFGMSLEDLEHKISQRTKVLIIQNTFGIPDRVQKILDIAKRHDIYVIEDCAHAVGSRVKGKLVGTFGDACILSFGRDKTFSSVFGGMVLTSDPETGARLSSEYSNVKTPTKRWILQQLIHPPLMTFARTLYGIFGIGKILTEIYRRLHLLSRAVEATEKRGERPKEAVRKMPNALAVLALHQSQKLNTFIEHRKKIVSIYQSLLSNVPAIKIFTSDVDSDSVFLRFPIQVRDRVLTMKQMEQKGFLLGDWYTTVVAPDGVSEEITRYTRGSCPNAETLIKHIVNLPTHIHVSEHDASRLLIALKKSV